jgi:hypothetical protein
MEPKIAKELDEKYDGIKPRSLEIFLEYMGLSEKEFNEIIDTMVIPPHKQILKIINFQKNCGITINGIEKIIEKNK